MRPFDENGRFWLDDQARLPRRAIRSVGVTVLSNAIVLVTQLAGTLILVRILTPADFGLIAMATMFSLLLSNFGVNGFTEGILQRKSIDHTLVSSLFWLNSAIGLALSVVFAAAGSLLAHFFREPRLTHVAMGLSPSIFITSLSVQHLALLKRAMRFSATSANDIAARLFSVVISVALALAGYGYWTLVVGVVVVPVSTCVGAWALCRWTPGAPRLTVELRSIIWFAGHIYTRFTLNYFCRNFDNLLVGSNFGAHALGFYKKAYDLFVLPVSQGVVPASEVALSALSRLDPRGSEYRHHFLSALSLLAFLGMGLSGALTLIGKDVVRILLGPQWEPAGKLFTIFAPGIAAMVLYPTHAWVHLSTGKANRFLRWGVIEIVFKSLCFLLALPWGPAGIAVAWTVSFWILTLPALWYAGRPIELRVAPVLDAIWRYLVAALFACLVSSLGVYRIVWLTHASGVAGAWARCVVTSLLFGATYVSFVIALHRGCEPLYRVHRLLRQFWPDKGSSDRTSVVSGGVSDRDYNSAPASNTAEALLVAEKRFIPIKEICLGERD